MVTLKEIIAAIESRRAALDRALEALRAVDGSVSTPPERGSAGATKKRGMVPERRRKLSEALKRYWALKRGAGSPSTAKVTKKRPGRPPGRKSTAV